MLLRPTRDGDVVSSSRVISEDLVLTFSASGLVRQATGIHGRLEVSMNDQVLEYSFLNIDKADDRIWMANRVHKMVFGDYDVKGSMRSAGMLNGKAGDLRKDYGLDSMQRDVTQFCSGVWSAWVEADIPTMVEGFDEPSEPEFLLEPYILDGGGTIIYALPGRGKSYLLMLLAVSIDAGVQTFWKVKTQPVLFINLERSTKSIRNRLTMVNRALGLEPKRPLLILNARGKSLQDVLPSAKAIIDRL